MDPIKYENMILPGTYGDKEVHLCHCIPATPNGIQVVLLHGVHSSANMGLHNKFRYLAELLSGRNFTPWLVETSRKIRNRHDFADNVHGWIKNAFEGKTFAQEQEDVFIAIRNVLSFSEGKPIWVWGFSLGGIIAVSAAAGAITFSGCSCSHVIDKIILSGTGLTAYRQVEDAMMTMPVLSTLRTSIPSDMLYSVKTGGIIAFRGSDDEIFSEKSCRDLISGINIPEEQKYFYTVEKCRPYRFVARNGKPDPGIMREMVDYIVRTWS